MIHSISLIQGRGRVWSYLNLMCHPFFKPMGVCHGMEAEEGMGRRGDGTGGEKRKQPVAKLNIL